MLFVGVMTGTSVDGLDLALLDLPTDLKPQAARTTPFPPSLRRRLVALSSAESDEIFRMGEAHIELGTFIGSTCLEFVRELGLAPSDIRAIGSHGQTIRHHPNADSPFSIQIGSGHVIAEQTGIDVVADFRARDIAAGGQGAPLVPNYHYELFTHEERVRVIVNIGGIANISILTPESASATGFDTGPGNALLDAWIQECRDKPFDLGGSWAMSGEIHEPLLERLLRDPYYEANPPKSTGKEHFNLTYLHDHIADFPNIAQADVQATLIELTTQSITSAIEREAAECVDVIVCGGGRQNDYLMTRLKEMNTKRAVVTCESLGIDGDAIESAAFAYLAWQFLERLPSNQPAVTGAVGLRVLGCLYPA
ncbi:MAG: anhydro-N-acetylmuramic acid kinase [Gammaproteobacteria bacterium]|nr:anhydro-N-acetylmuramic acid kinase [Gammaproteobacteria bacterium]